jgi:hypothetical protein
MVRYTEPMAVTYVSGSTVAGVSRVTATVDGFDVWFMSRDAELVPSGEALGTAFLIPALHAERRLRIDQPTDGQWARNVVEVVETVTQWWDTPAWAPAAFPNRPQQPAPGSGLFFTGGVDSFFTLLRSDRSIDYLIHVQGFDIPFSDSTRLLSAEADARAVADALGLECLVVKTNLQAHPAYQSVSWERTHGGALIAIAHLLRRYIGRVLISSSAHRSVTRPWGSDRRIDRYWSSTALSVEHFGEDWWRHQKLEQIADHDLVGRYLRVCWEHLTTAPNCSRCDKCVRTMITLAAAGLLEHSGRFESGRLVDRIDSLSSARGPGNRREYMIMLEDDLDGPTARAVNDLLARSPAPSPVEE